VRPATSRERVGDLSGEGRDLSGSVGDLSGEARDLSPVLRDLCLVGHQAPEVLR
jgi:hypothetical protein